MESSTPGRHPVVQRLRAAINAHDLVALVGCFARDYRSTFPAHPDRAFAGQEQVRRNWSRIFEGVPDIQAEILREALVGDTHWGEWRWFGTQRDGTPMVMRGVIIFGVAGEHLDWGRLYMEHLEQEGAGIDRAVERVAGASPPSPERGAQP
jgi:ketosteroid isomerase-like protein